MPILKPFRRNFRAVRSGPDRPNAGHSSWAYIAEPEYAEAPEHYLRSFLILQADLQKLFEFVEPSDLCLKAYSFRIHDLLMRICIEVEANLKAILRENIYTPQVDRFRQPIYNMTIYRKINRTHHLSSYGVKLPIWGGSGRIMRPFASWDANATLLWYRAYNESKQDRMAAFKMANFESLIDPMAGLLVIITAQFKDQEFSSGSTFLALAGSKREGFESVIGSLFRINPETDLRPANFEGATG